MTATELETLMNDIIALQGAYDRTIEHLEVCQESQVEYYQKRARNIRQNIFKAKAELKNALN